MCLCLCDKVDAWNITTRNKADNSHTTACPAHLAGEGCSFGIVRDDPFELSDKACVEDSGQTLKANDFIEQGL